MSTPIPSAAARPGSGRTVTFRLADMDCPHEGRQVEACLRGINGVHELGFDYARREVTVRHGLSDEECLREALAGIGFPPGSPSEAETSAESRSRRTAWVRAGLALVLALTAEIAGLLGQPEDSLPVVGLSALPLLVLGPFLAGKALAELRRRELGIHVLMFIASAGAVLLGEWPEAAMVVSLFAIAEELESDSLARVKDAVGDLLQLRPQEAEVLGDCGAWETVSVCRVRPGQQVRVRPGEQIPLDGTVVGGGSTVNQAPITGESLPVEKAPGDPVYAGSLNEAGVLEFTVTKAAGDTLLDRMARFVATARLRRAPMERFVDRFARHYTPAVVGAAVLVALVPPALGQPFATWSYRALVLLVIACPCALVISTPVTIVSALAAAARRGMLIKGGACLEQLRRLRVVAFDKTGTLTEGRPALTDVVSLSDEAPARLLHVAASLSAASEHPVGAAIVRKCAGSHGDDPCIPFPVSDFQAVAGQGVVGTLNGKRHFVGSRRLSNSEHAAGPAVEETVTRLEHEGKTAVILGATEEPLAVLAVADAPRPDAPCVLHDLEELGLRAVMLTGDNETTARAVAAHVGIREVYSGLLPADKVAVVEELERRYGPAGMVGDGINDAPALARASVGIAMGGSGTAVALETADVVLMRDDLHDIPRLIALSRTTGRVLVQNLSLALGLKGAFLLMALAGQATLWMGVLADVGASLLVVFNGLRLLRAVPPPPPGQTCPGSPPSS